jgi:hypothetical protein
MEERALDDDQVGVFGVILLRLRGRGHARNPFRLFLDDHPMAQRAPVLLHVGIDLDHVAVGIMLVNGAGNVVIHDEGELDGSLLGPIVAVDQVGLGFELEGEMPHPGLLVLGGILAVNIGQAEVVVGVAIAEKARPVVGLAIDLFKADHRLIELGCTLIIADEQIGVSQPARPEESPCFGLL